MTTTAQLVSAANAANWNSLKSLVASATPADIAAIGSDWNTVMSAVADGINNNAPAHKAAFSSAMTAFFSAAGSYLTGDSVVAALSSVAYNSGGNGVDHLSVELTVLLKAVPISVAATVSQASLTTLMSDIANNQVNPEVTPEELKNTFSALVGKFGTQLDVNALLDTVSFLSNGPFFPPTDQLPSVNVLLQAMPSNTSSVSSFSVNNALTNISVLKSNPEVTPQELNSTLKIFVAHYGAALDAQTILFTVNSLAEDSSFPSQNYFAAVRTLLSIHPTDLSSVNSSNLQDTMTHLVFTVNNPAVSSAELNTTLKAFIAQYGSLMSAEFLVDAAENFASAAAQTGSDYLAEVRTLLGAEGSNPTQVNPSSLSNLVNAILYNQISPEITPAEFNSTFKVFVDHYGALTNVNTILSAVSFILSTSDQRFTDQTAAVRTLLNASPADIGSTDPNYVQSVFYDLVFSSVNPTISSEDYNSTMRAFLTHYGAALDVATILNGISSIANADRNTATDHFSAINTLLDFHPTDAGAADAGTLSSVLTEIDFNVVNPAVSEHEIAQTLAKYMHAYGALSSTADLAEVISDEVQNSRFEAAGAVVNHLTATQFADAETDLSLDPSAGAVQLLTTGNDQYNGATSGPVAVFGGAGHDTIDFSTATDSHYLDGGAGVDRLIGGSADDILNGGAGADTLSGGAGTDTFRFDHAGPIDHVTDFNAAQGDRLDLHDLFHTTGSFAISDYVSLQTVGGNTIVSVDRDGAAGGSGFVQVAQLDGVTGLDVNDLFAHGQIIV